MTCFEEVPGNPMFMIHKPSQALIDRFIFEQRRHGFSYPDVGATRGKLPVGYKIDHNRARLGHGVQLFRQAAASLRLWQMFNLGWVQIFPSNAQIEAGATVGVLAHHFGFWSLNACRIVYVIDEERRYGFAYGTLRDHAEEGEERFSLEWGTEDDSVVYDILAFSRPRQWQAKAARPLSRMLQRRFARDSMAAMKRGTFS
ncbi:MAG TPA: DUF1990 domain-containing protein [Terriglobia bacterium]|nr:DUF1990 domain-containing protein [Terriglobia bacterium]